MSPFNLEEYALPTKKLKESLGGALNQHRQKFSSWSSRKKLVVLALGGFFIFLAGSFLLKHFRKPPKRNNGVIVGVQSAWLGDVSVYLDELGTVTAYYTVTIQPRVSGQIMAVYVKEGQEVHPGQLLALIDPRPYQAALDQAKGALARDQALLADAKLDLNRYQKLLAQDAIPSQQYDTQKATVGQYEGIVESDQAAIETAQLNLEYAHVTSPIEGRVGLRLVDPGNVAYTTTANGANGIFVVTTLQPITVVFTLPEEDIPRLMERLNQLKKGQKLRVDAYSRDGKIKLATGVLLALDSQIQVNTGTLNLKAKFTNKKRMLYPNEFINARLYLEQKKNQILIPRVAVQTGPQGSFVYVVKPDQTVEVRTIEVGVTNGDNVSVNQGLKTGEMVVTDGMDFIRPGSKVHFSMPQKNKQSASSKFKRTQSE